MNRFFSYDGEIYETHDTAEAAKNSAENELSSFRHDAGNHEGWSELAGYVAWGEIVQNATECDVLKREDADEDEAESMDNRGVDYVCDYQLADVDPPQPGQEMTNTQKLAIWEAWARKNEAYLNDAILLSAAHGKPYNGGAWPLSVYERPAGPQNENRRRWYGVRPGDKGTYMGEPIVVVRLHGTDNNGCTVRYTAGKLEHREEKAVCEWLVIVHRVETANDVVQAERSEAQEMYEDGVTCTCHACPPCGFCVAMTEEESDVYAADGLEGLDRLWDSEPTTNEEGDSA